MENKQMPVWVFVLLAALLNFVVTFSLSGMVYFSNRVAETLPATAIGFFLGRLFSGYKRRRWLEIVGFTGLNIATTFFGAGIENALDATDNGNKWSVISVGFALVITLIAGLILNRRPQRDAVEALPEGVSRNGAERSSNLSPLNPQMLALIGVILGVVGAVAFYPKAREQLLELGASRGHIPSLIALSDLRTTQAIDIAISGDEAQGHRLVDESRKMLLGPAKRGDLGAMHALGQNLVRNILEVNEEDFAEGITWLEKSANKGHVPSMKRVGLAHISSATYAKSIEGQKRGAYWLLKAAEAGDVESQRIVGVRYMTGYGLPQDFSKSRFWLKKAAAQGEETEDDLEELESRIANQPRKRLPGKLGAFTVLSDAGAAKSMGFTNCTPNEAQRIIKCDLALPSKLTLFGVPLQGASLNLVNQDMTKYGFDGGIEFRKPLLGSRFEDLRYGVIHLDFRPEQYKVDCASPAKNWGRPLNCAVEGTLAEVLAHMATQGWVLTNPHEAPPSIQEWQHERERVQILMGSELPGRLTLSASKFPEEITKEIAEARAAAPTVEDIVDLMKP